MTRTLWGEAHIPEQTGRTALVTGANSGIGFETARALAQAGATVWLGCRDDERGRDAVRRIEFAVADAQVRLLSLDLADLSSVRRAAAEVIGGTERLDVLVDNAGVMAIPHQHTVDGFEMQFGVNHLGHFALTGLLLDHLEAGRAARVVSVSSIGHRLGRIDFDDLDARRTYHRWLRYGQSKVANLLFVHEMQRRLTAAGATTIAVACHPGGATTQLGRDAGTMMRLAGPLVERATQPAAMGALPSLRAATDPAVQGADYYGPDGIGQVGGHPVLVHANAYSHRRDVASRLWEVSEELTGVAFLDEAAD